MPKLLKTHGTVNMADAEVYFPEHIPDILIDGYQGVTISNGVIRINLLQHKFGSTDKPSETRTVIVGRLAMGLPALTSIHQAMGELIESLQADANSVGPDEDSGENGG